ncbi:MAG: hypothetical protein AAF478_13200 [Pseudomonadota bacterium]
MTLFRQITYMSAVFAGVFSLAVMLLYAFPAHAKEECISLDHQIETVPGKFEQYGRYVVLAVWHNKEEGAEGFTLYSFRRDIPGYVGMQFFNRDRCLVSRGGDPLFWYVIKMNDKISQNVEAGEIVYQSPPKLPVTKES